MTNVELYISRNQTFGHDSHLWCTSSFSLSPSLPFFTLCYLQLIVFIGAFSLSHLSYPVCRLLLLSLQDLQRHSTMATDPSAHSTSRGWQCNAMPPHLFVTEFHSWLEFFLHRCRCCTPTQTARPMRNFSKKTRSHRATVTWTKKMKYVCVGTHVSLL